MGRERPVTGLMHRPCAYGNAIIRFPGSAVARRPFSRYPHRMGSDSDILFERRGAAGLITLNRPQALNAVTHPMVGALAARLANWAQDPAVTRVVIRAAGE